MMGKSVSSAPLALSVEDGDCCNSSMWALREGLETKELEKPATEGEALWWRCKPLKVKHLQSFNFPGFAFKLLNRKVCVLKI